MLKERKESLIQRNDSPVNGIPVKIILYIYIIIFTTFVVTGGLFFDSRPTMYNSDVSQKTKHLSSI